MSDFDKFMNSVMFYFACRIVCWIILLVIITIARQLLV